MTDKLDYSLPLSNLLKAATATAHEQAENSRGAAWLTRGELDKDEYVRFLMMLYHVYNTLERGLEKHSSHPVLAPTYNPALLARAPNLSSDIAHLLDIPEKSWKSHPTHIALQSSPPPAFSAFISRLQYLADSDTINNHPDQHTHAPRLLAHAYVRYLGDLSGGQIIRRRIERAYGLDRADGLGTKFYDFKQLGTASAPATMGDMRKIKEWYRDGMNSGAGQDEHVKREIVDEAVKAFEYNTSLFETLRPPSNLSISGPDKSETHTKSSYAISRVDDASSTPTNNSSNPPESRTSGRNLTISSVLAFILAASIAHFALVVSGFTGESGYLKLLAVQEWFGSLVTSFRS